MSKPSGKTAKKDSKADVIIKPVELIVRPSKAADSNSSKVYLSLETLKENGIEAGSYIQLQGNTVLGIATPSAVDRDCIQISLGLQVLANLYPGDRIKLVKATKPTPCASLSIKCDKTDDEKDLEELIRNIGLLHLTQRIGEKKLVVNSFKCENSKAENNADIAKNDLKGPTLINKNTEISFSSVEEEISVSNEFGRIGGLGKELDLVRAQVELPLKYPEYFSRFNTDPEKGLLLYGPPGTGKTMLLKAVARETSDAHILRVNGPSIYSKYQGETESKLRSIFEEAERFAPSIIFIDEIDALAPRRDQDDSGETESRVVATLLTLMDGMKPNSRVVVIGATNRPNILDPALRRPGRLGHEIEIGIPDAAARLNILNIMLDNVPNHLTLADITEVSEKTHGYVGADLQALVKEAVVKVVRKSLELGRSPNEMFLERSDLESAIITVRPSAMREISLEMPKVHWSDIGGQESTIQRLKETVEWPLQHKKTFDKLGITPPSGVLLYGPPGCSKTLLAKALATETGLNFLAVKGPELFNKYVGESEKALREIFRKARQAAPSIIFFDEIDALSVARGEGEAGGDRVLTSLLNEMDGIESLNGVVVLAATNRPEIIDSALMRSGRLDRIIYVRPPGYEARRQILLIQLAKMATADDVDLDGLAELTDGFSGAELVSVCQEAGLLAMNEDADIEYISQKHFETALKGIRKTITPEMVKFYEEFAGLA